MLEWSDPKIFSPKNLIFERFRANGATFFFRPSAEKNLLKNKGGFVAKGGLLLGMGRMSSHYTKVSPTWVAMEWDLRHLSEKRHIFFLRIFDLLARFSKYDFWNLWEISRRHSKKKNVRYFFKIKNISKTSEKNIFWDFFEIAGFY